jgi:HK97 family phage major capsid protein
MPKRKNEAKMLHRSFDLKREFINEEKRTVELAFSSETDKVERWFGIEILDHGAGSIRLGRLQNNAPLLMDHDMRDQIGVVESISIDSDRVARAVVRFGKSKRAKEIFTDVVDGIRGKVSVGYMIHSREETDEGTEHKPVYRVKDWEPYEISMVSVPADDSVGAGRQAANLIEVNEENSMPKETEQSTVTETTERAQPVIDVKVEIEQIRKAELLRINEIQSIGSKRGLDSLAKTFIDNGKSLDEFRAAVLDSMPEPKAAPSADDAEIGLTDREARSFSFVRALNALANPNNAAFQRAAGFEFEVSAAVAERMGNTPKGLYVPLDVMRRDLTVAGSAGNTVSTNVLAGSFIETLENAMVTNALGATILRDLVGNVAIPRMTAGSTAYWVAENGDITESDQTFDQVTLSPKTVGAMTEISRKTLLQSSLDIEALIRNELAMRLALAIDSKAVTGDGTSNTPTGIMSTSGIGSKTFAALGAPTFGEVVDVESQVSIDNALMGSLSYLTTAAMAGGMKQKAKDAGSGRFVIEDGQANGYPVALSNTVTANSLLFGNWADLLIGFWGGLDVNVDTSTGSASGRVRVVSLQDVDVAVRHAQSFAVGNGGV